MNANKITLDPIPGYTRSLVDGNTKLVRSECDYCGFSITGSVSAYLADEEKWHRDKCTKPAQLSVVPTPHAR